MKILFITFICALVTSFVILRLIAKSYNQHIKDEAVKIIKENKDSVYLNDIKHSYAKNDIKALRTAIDNYNQWQS